MNTPLLSRLLALGDVRSPKEVEIVATADERAALAAEYDLLSVAGLSATVTVSPEAAGGVIVAGRLVADIEQPCVVTLVPVPQHIDEPFEVRFVRPGSPELPASVRPNEEVVVDPASPDPPEVLTGSSLDLGAIVEEALVLAIDPYPRAPGAVLPQEASDAGDVPDSPFAALARLKTPKN